METKQSVRIQHSILNELERKVLIWVASRLPRCVTSDMMTWLGVFGAFLCGAGFVLTHKDILWLWLSVAGLFLNWFGDSLDGTIARVRNQQRPLYGYYLDHNVDVICEFFIFTGLGLSSIAHLGLALLAFVLYLALTVYVNINAHLKNEFRLTYGKLGPTELRLSIVFICLLYMYVPFFLDFEGHAHIWVWTFSYGLFDILGSGIILTMMVMYAVYFVKDARWFAERDPLKRPADE